MKKSLCLLSVLTIVFFTIQLQAQTRFGLKGGVNFANINYKNAYSVSPPTGMTSFNVGVITDINFAKKFFFQPALSINGKGYKVLLDGIIDITYNPIYLEIPLNVGGRLEVAKNLKVYGMIGPYFAFGIAGKRKVGSNPANIDWGNSTFKDFKATDIGLNIGTGIEVRNFIIGLQYGIGFTNIFPNDVNLYDTSLKNKVFSISTGYLFGKK